MTHTGFGSRSGDRATSGARTEVTASWRRVIPLWRHAVWLVAGVVLVGLWVDVRVDVQQLRTDVSRSGRAYREALQENQHLRLELETRRRALAMEAEARELGLVDEVERRELAVTPDRVASVGAP